MEIQNVHTFRTIVEAGGLTKAAKLLHLTPGAVSKALGRFEAELGRPLFYRSGRGLLPTDLGKRLYRRSGRLMAEHAQLAAALDASGPGPEEVLRVASFEVFTTHCLAPVLAAHFPGRAVQVADVGVGAIESAVQAGEADFGVTYVPVPRPGLHNEPVCDIGFGIWGHGPTFAAKPFAELPFAIPVTRLNLGAGEELGIDCWPYERVARRVRYRLTALESALALARARQCVVFVPDFIGRLHNVAARRGAQLHRLPDPPGLGAVVRRVWVVARDEHRHDAGLGKLVRAFAAVIGG